MYALHKYLADFSDQFPKKKCEFLAQPQNYNYYIVRLVRCKIWGIHWNTTQKPKKVATQIIGVGQIFLKQMCPKLEIPSQQQLLQVQVSQHLHGLVPTMCLSWFSQEITVFYNYLCKSRCNNSTSMLRGRTGSWSESLRRNHPPYPETRTCFQNEVRETCLIRWWTYNCPIVVARISMQFK